MMVYRIGGSLGLIVGPVIPSAARNPAQHVVIVSVERIFAPKTPLRMTASGGSNENTRTGV
jgi:hypothetical protein